MFGHWYRFFTPAWGLLRQRRANRCFLAIACWLALGVWIPVMAQSAAPETSTPATGTPNTVVLPPVQLHMPFVVGESIAASPCPITSTNSYETTPILGDPRDPDRPPVLDPDLNLDIRGYKRISATLELIAINGPTDDDAPQLAHLFRPVRVPTLRAAHQVYDWDWACCPGGKIGAPIAEPEVTLVEMETTPGEVLYPPQRNATISRDFVAMVLYANQFQITFGYTRDDSPAYGYVVHVENLCVDPNLLSLYHEMHVEGRDDLPALRRSDGIGTAYTSSISVAVRDSGSFMDPRSAKDWWQETVRARLAAQQSALPPAP